MYICMYVCMCVFIFPCMSAMCTSVLILQYNYDCYIFTLNRAVNQRHTSVNMRKKIT